MSLIKRISITNDLDIVTARLRTREVARELGFGTVDQARISLAAGELARVLAENVGGQGEIVISEANESGQKGICVVSLNPGMADANLSSIPSDDLSQKIANALNLVDEYLVEDQDQLGTRVTLMKWLT